MAALGKVRRYLQQQKRKEFLNFEHIAVEYFLVFKVTALFYC